MSQSVKETGRFLRQIFIDLASPNCILRGIAEPHAPSFFDTLVEDNLRARYVQNSTSFEELVGFYHNQRWMHMHAVLRGQGITFQELGHRGIEAALAILEAQGFSREEASSELGHRRRRGALASLEAQGFTGEGGTRTASTELGHRGYGGTLASLEEQGFTGEGGMRSASTKHGHRRRNDALASLEAQGFTGEGGTRTASTELGRRGGVAYSAIYRKSDNCSYPGCTDAIRNMLHNRGYCDHHCPKKPEKPKKSEKCRVCGRVFGTKE